MFREFFIEKDLDKKLNDLKDSYRSLIKTLDSFNGVLDHPINKEDLLAFPLLEWVQLNDKVKIRRRRNVFSNYLNFDTTLLKGGEFGKHFHEDIIESCEILVGRMKDLEDGKVYKEDDIMHYDKGEHHTPVALEDTTLKVLFKP